MYVTGKYSTGICMTEQLLPGTVLTFRTGQLLRVGRETGTNVLATFRTGH